MPSLSSSPVQAINGARELLSGNGLLIQRFGWIAAVFAVIVQQSAFVASPVLSSAADIGSPDTQANVFNTLAVSMNLILIAPLCLLQYRQIAFIIWGNKTAVALIVLIFLSTAWSLHPDVTIRRSVNYLSTIVTACYLAARFDIDEIMKILSWGIGISAVSSFLFVAAFPIDAIHQASPLQIEDIAGSWKGVFPHKNILGQAMTVGVIAQLYLLLNKRAGTTWHALMLCVCLALVILSRSSSAIILAALYLLGASLIFVLQRAPRYFGVSLAMLAVLGLSMATVYWADPNSLWEGLGRDPTLTGRTVLWGLILPLISEKPILGWGYSAMWLPNEPIALAISQTVGWRVPSAHNTFLEVALGLGLVGLVIVLLFLFISIWRSVRCLIAGQHKLGMISLLFFVGVTISGATESTLAQNQSIQWAVFNVLSFSCGLEIMRRHVGKAELTSMTLSASEKC